MKINIQILLCNWNNKLIFCLSGLLAFIFSISNSASASEPKPWQMDLQPPAGIIAEKATDLHNFLFWYLISLHLTQCLRLWLDLHIFLFWYLVSLHYYWLRFLLLI